MAMKKQCQSFLLKLKNYRNFSDNSYINNSYLNYVQINKHNKKDSKKIEHNINTQENGELKNINNKNSNFLNNSNNLNKNEKNEQQSYGNIHKDNLINDNDNDNDNDNSYKINTNESRSLYPSDDLSTKWESIKEKKNIQKTKSVEHQFFDKKDTNDFLKETNINIKNNKPPYENERKQLKENTYGSKVKYDNIKNNKNKKLYVEKDLEDNFENEDHYNIEKETSQFSKGNIMQDDAIDDKDTSIDENENTDEIYDKSIIQMNDNDTNDSFDENNYEKLNLKDEKKKVSDNNDDNNNYNSKENKDGQDFWEENEEDLPNIFEVDENLTEEEKKEKLKLIKLITEKLAGPLKSNKGENSLEAKENSATDDNTTNDEDSIFADNRPIAIEVDGPSHFYANSNRYTTYTKLKHRILTKLGYNVIHISYIDWRKLRNKSEREEFILKKLKEKNDEFLDENDRIYYNERMNMIKEDYMKYMKNKNEKNP